MAVGIGPGSFAGQDVDVLPPLRASPSRPAGRSHSDDHDGAAASSAPPTARTTTPHPDILRVAWLSPPALVPSSSSSSTSSSSGWSAAARAAASRPSLALVRAWLLHHLQSLMLRSVRSAGWPRGGGDCPAERRDTSATRGPPALVESGPGRASHSIRILSAAAEPARSQSSSASGSKASGAERAVRPPRSVEGSSVGGRRRDPDLDLSSRCALSPRSVAASSVCGCRRDLGLDPSSRCDGAATAPRPRRALYAESLRS
mmetsp:Transcript_33473/g.75624  ORF Transcript_33473/g.75624 Transcript_33473/m.75624 type:complete len:259 (-) Transcript_33473:1037-1813(-)